MSQIIISRKPFPANISSGKNNFIMMTSLLFLFVLTAFFTIPVLIIPLRLETESYIPYSICVKKIVHLSGPLALLSSTEARTDSCDLRKDDIFSGSKGMSRPNGKKYGIL
jgi:hypothetical protein